MKLKQNLGDQHLIYTYFLKTINNNKLELQKKSTINKRFSSSTPKKKYGNHKLSTFVSYSIILHKNKLNNILVEYLLNDHKLERK